jgi:hypothetical protein
MSAKGKGGAVECVQGMLLSRLGQMQLICRGGGMLLLMTDTRSRP